MLKNAPMFKRLDARIRGKGSALGVGRGRAVAMRARVPVATVKYYRLSSVTAIDSSYYFPASWHCLWRKRLGVAALRVGEQFLRLEGRDDH
ncbi:hypothetical protein ZIOFF_065232 [Zingiber officinale]|uniref:Uncharacterized protein n=1 Tax=Zingiber officinale TaxID=94328 RepID=A0A8J5KD14_ZINOF|nr:hypothetical protein ZIOFF_065232 [Zingiber officinale]